MGVAVDIDDAAAARVVAAHFNLIAAGEALVAQPGREAVGVKRLSDG